MTEQHQPIKKDAGFDWAYAGAATRDFASGAQPALSVGMDAGKRGASFGFWSAKESINAVSRALQKGSIPMVPTVLSAVTGILDVCEFVTVSAIDASHATTRTVLTQTDSLLASAGVENGVIEPALLGASPGVHAFAKILQMVVEFAHGLEGVPVTVVAAGLAQLRRLQHEESANQQANVSEDASLSTPSNAEILRMMSFSAACYEELVMRFLGVLKMNETCVDVLCPRGALLLAKKTEGDLYHPGWFAFKDDVNKQIVIAVRGTIRPHDAVTDLMCMHESIEHPFPEAKYEVHGGMWKAAENVSVALSDTVTKIWKENPEYELVLTGHSLGAGVATLLYLKWMKKTCPLPSRNIRCIVFAPPCTCSAALSRDNPAIFNVVNRDDMVSRFGLKTMQDLRNMAVRLGKEPTLTLEVLRKDSAALAKTGNLFPAGRILHIQDDLQAKNAKTQVRREGTFFHEILLSDTMFSDHMPDAYLREMRRL